MKNVILNHRRRTKSGCISYVVTLNRNNILKAAHFDVDKLTFISPQILF